MNGAFLFSIRRTAFSDAIAAALLSLMDNNHYGYLYVYIILSLNLRKGKAVFTAIDTLIPN